jgi:hypothetical protein
VAPQVKEGSLHNPQVRAPGRIRLECSFSELLKNNSYHAGLVIWSQFRDS